MPKPASLRNLRPWKPGQSGNPNGRPRAPGFTERDQHAILTALAGAFGEGTQTRYRREYVPQSELARVRRWIRRSRADRARGRAVLSLLRHYVTGMEARARYRARMRAAQRS